MKVSSFNATLETNRLSHFLAPRSQRYNNHYNGSKEQLFPDSFPAFASLNTLFRLICRLILSWCWITTDLFSVGEPCARESDVAGCAIFSKVHRQTWLADGHANAGLAQIKTDPRKQANAFLKSKSHLLYAERPILCTGWSPA